MNALQNHTFLNVGDIYLINYARPPCFSCFVFITINLAQFNINLQEKPVEEILKHSY